MLSYYVFDIVVKEGEIEKIDQIYRVRCVEGEIEKRKKKGRRKETIAKREKKRDQSG